jgi:predicted acylesterase/phospholipase RssA
LMLEKKFKPDVISGISAGAILSLPLALGKFDEARALVRHLQLSDFFSASPVRSNGKFTLGALWKVISGKPYLGKQGHLEDKLRSLISEQEFTRYQKDNSKPACIVGAVDFITGGRIYSNLKRVSYADFPKIVNASSSLPIFTEGIRIELAGQHVYLYDGGVRDHIATAYVLGDDDSEFKDKITESVSVFSRPEDFKVLPEEFDDKNVIAILSRYVDITNVEVSKNDEFMLDDICARKNIRNTKLFLPRVMKTVYDTDPARLEQLYQAGLTEGRKYKPEVSVLKPV